MINGQGIDVTGCWPSHDPAPVDCFPKVLTPTRVLSERVEEDKKEHEVQIFQRCNYCLCWIYFYSNYGYCLQLTIILGATGYQALSSQELYALFVQNTPQPFYNHISGIYAIFIASSPELPLWILNTFVGCILSRRGVRSLYLVRSKCNHLSDVEQPSS